MFCDAKMMPCHVSHAEKFGESENGWCRVDRLVGGKILRIFITVSIIL